jgi:hypothetical protein
MRSANNLTLMTGKIYLSEQIRIADFGGLNFGTLNTRTLERWHKHRQKSTLTFYRAGKSTVRN